MSFGQRLARSGELIVPPLLLLLLLGYGWHEAVRQWDIKPYFLPSPLDVLAVVIKDFPQLARATAYTGAAAVLGFLASLVVGTLTAFAFSQSRWLRRSGYPYAVFLQTVPIVAIAQLIVKWFGHGFQSVVIVAFLISLFPIISNATSGLMSVEPDLVDLFRVNNASRVQVLFKLRLPNSVPSIVTGARTSSGLAVVGAIVGEYFTGYSAQMTGLGTMILQTLDALKLAGTFAAVLASTTLALAIFGVASLIGDRILRHWYEPPADHRS